MKNLDAKLERYAALAAGMAVVGGTANAQMQYVDVSPDVTIFSGGTPAYYTMDLNGDSAPDVYFGMISGSQTGSFYSSGISATAFYWLYFGGGLGLASISSNGNALMQATNGAFYDVSALSTVNGIGPSASNFVGQTGRMNLKQSTYFTWNSGSNTFFGGPNTNGSFNDNNDHYVGIRFKIGANDHYGWIRVNGDDGNQLIIKDYAYELTPNAAVTSVIENVINVDITNYDNKLYIKANDIDITGGKIELTNLAGQVVESFDINSNQEVINLDGYTQGVYLVTLKITEGVKVEKIYVR